MQFGGYAWITCWWRWRCRSTSSCSRALFLFVDATWPSWLALATFAVFTVVLVRRIVINDRSPCNCFGAGSSKRDLGIGSLLRNTWFLALALIATGTTTMAEPTAMLGTVLLGCGFLAVLGGVGGAHVNVVVLVGTETSAAALGETARALESDTTRAAVFVGDVTTPEGRAALEEFVQELFPT